MSRHVATKLVTSDAVVFDWPYRPSRDRMITIAPAETIRLCLSENAYERAKGAARLNIVQLRALFDRPARWQNLARAARRVLKWKVEPYATSLGERRLLHCCQCRSRDAFLARYAGSKDPELTGYKPKKRRRR